MRYSKMYMIKYAHIDKIYICILDITKYKIMYLFIMICLCSYDEVYFIGIPN